MQLFLIVSCHSATVWGPQDPLQNMWKGPSPLLCLCAHAVLSSPSTTSLPNNVFWRYSCLCPCTQRLGPPPPLTTPAYPIPPHCITGTGSVLSHHFHISVLIFTSGKHLHKKIKNSEHSLITFPGIKIWLNNGSCMLELKNAAFIGV